MKAPRVQQAKHRDSQRLWHSDLEARSIVGEAEEYDYSNRGRLVPFTGIHPQVMAARVASRDWSFVYDPKRSGMTHSERFLDWIEKQTGVRFAEYRNYRLL